MKIIFPESFFVGGKPGLYLKCYQNKPNENKSNRNKTKTKQIRKKTATIEKARKQVKRKLSKTSTTNRIKNMSFVFYFIIVNQNILVVMLLSPTGKLGQRKLV